MIIINARQKMKEDWIRESDLFSFQVINPDASPVALWKRGKKEEPIFLKSDICYPESETAWGKKGFKLKQGEQPIAYFSARIGKAITYAVYGDWQVVEKRTITEKPPQEIDLLLAIFTVNRAAKRYREAGQGQYRSKSHGLAGASKQKKIDLYKLKDKGISEAIRRGLLERDGEHGGYAVYRGGGYCFHTGPASVKQTEELVKISAKEKEKKEPRLKDAVYTLENI